MTLEKFQRYLDAASWAGYMFAADCVAVYRRLVRIWRPVRFARGSDGAKWVKTSSKRLGHWKLPVEAPSPIIESPNCVYVLGSRLGAGDLCDVYHASGGGEPCAVKISRVKEGNHLLAKEYHVLGQLAKHRGDTRYGEYFPRGVETLLFDGRRVNVFRWRDGFHSAEQIRQRYSRGLDGRHLAWMFNRMLEAIGYVHEQGWLHGAVLPPHLLFHADNHALQLVDWIHAERPRRVLQMAPTRFIAWYPPECRGRQPASRSVDIYLAAKSLVYLAGGDPSGNRMPNHVPAAIRRFVRGCLLDSPKMRPQDAWELHAEFRALLEDVYGAPCYHRLEMSFNP